MSNFSVELKNKEVLKHLKGMPKIGVLSLVAGTNKTAKQGTNVGIRAMTKRYTIKAKRIKDNVKVTRWATRGSIRATITADQGRVPGLQHSRPGRRGRRGITVMVQRGKRKHITGGFISPGADGKGIGLFVGSGIKVKPKRGVYKGRMLTRGPRAGQQMEREFLERKFGPSPTGMWRRRGRVKVRRFVRDNYGRIVMAEYRFRLRRALGQR